MFCNPKTFQVTDVYSSEYSFIQTCNGIFSSPFCNRTMHERLRCFVTIVIINGTRFTSYDVERFVLSFDILKSQIDYIPIEVFKYW